MTPDMSLLTNEMRSVLAPLEGEWERRAIDAVLEASGALRGNAIVRGVELAIDKPSRRGDRPQRRVRVLLSARDDSAVHEFLVDTDGKVVSERDLGPRNP